jgi:NAD(P)-dependent dehydrogenase (short-subunit alcohol dehydrogenase family)
MANEWARHGIRVNAIAPGYIATDMADEFIASERGRKVTAAIAQRRVGSVDELSGALLLLASAASSYMTGSTITVDGGLSLGTI